MTWNQIIKRATREALIRVQGSDDAGLLADAVTEVLEEWAEEAARDREQFGEPYETEVVESCDDAGTGEGRYHGRI